MDGHDVRWPNILTWPSSPLCSSLPSFTPFFLLLSLLPPSLPPSLPLSPFPFSPPSSLPPSLPSSLPPLLSTDVAEPPQEAMYERSSVDRLQGAHLLKWKDHQGSTILTALDHTTTILNSTIMCHVNVHIQHTSIHIYDNFSSFRKRWWADLGGEIWYNGIVLLCNHCHCILQEMLELAKGYNKVWCDEWGRPSN